jgi:hypothetical protein
MFEVTEENYRQYLTWHGHDPEVAQWVVENHDANSPLASVRLWIEASKMVLKKHGI